MSFTPLEIFRVRCDWESDNAACGIAIEVTGFNSFEVFEELRRRGWQVDVYQARAETYCPDCKGSVPEPPPGV